MADSQDTGQASGATLRPEGGEGPGAWIGRYRLLQEIGSGGYGSVFEADQTHPVKRRVALKLIKLGMDTREVIARFEAERQALALMDHPHIARVLDAGATDSGRPFFVMELVPGEPITAFCDRQRLSVEQRLRLFEQVCAAVQHAHTKGVIHRDIKPSNVLVSTVSDQPFAKVIDFGIAKATSARLTEHTLYTGQQQMIGTPLYMSPEQAEGSADIDTRTDIWSLGVLLYELLTGTTPFAAGPTTDLQRAIRDQDPQRPSARVTASSPRSGEAAARRRSDPRRLAGTLRGALDWIAMKALEKDRVRRYETANALAMDVRRFLAHEPVLAAPPSATYRLRQFVRRNRVGVAAALAVALALVGGAGAFAWQARIAAQRAEELAAVAAFQAEMLGQVDPTVAGRALVADLEQRFGAALQGGGIAPDAQTTQRAAFSAQLARLNATDAARELIDASLLRPAVAAIDRQFGGQPVVAASLRQVLATRYRTMGLYEPSAALQAQALDARRDVLGPDHPDTLRSQLEAAELALARALPKDAEDLARDALARLRRRLGANDPMTLEALNLVGVVLVTSGRVAEAEPLIGDALAGRRRVLAADHPDLVESISNFGYVLRMQNRFAEAEPLYREVLEVRRRVLGPAHRDTIGSLSNLAAMLKASGRAAEAVPFSEQALASSREVNGEDHPDTIVQLNNVGVLLKELARYDEAEPHIVAAAERTRRVLGAEHRLTLIAAINLGSQRVEQGRAAEALAALEPVEAQARVIFTGANAAWVASILANQGRALDALGQFEPAEQRLDEALAIYLESRGEKHPDTRTCLRALVAHHLAREAATPGRGFAQRAESYRQRLADAGG
jgi:tetratricopeptide (TPR) repeat protein/tRNA A-37 threonylcarbamoyl transferase component Bud32